MKLTVDNGVVVQKMVGTLFAQPAFQKEFGQMVHEGKYEIPAPWQAGLNNGATLGQLAGMLAAGYLTERYGFRPTMLAGQIAIIGVIFIQFFAKSLPMLEVAQILFGQFLPL